MAEPQQVNIAGVVDRGKVGGFQIGIFVLCAACLIMDGFDVQAIGYVAPEIIRELGLTPAQMAPVTSAGLIGILIGALVFGTAADRFGRRPTLIAATLSFSVLTFLTGYAGSVTALVVLRFLAGVPLGGILPNVVALVGEYSPARWRALLMIVVQNGFNAGAVLGGLIAASLMPRFGWPSVFLFGGLVPLLVSILMFWFLPESLQYLALRRKGSPELAKWVRRIDPEAPDPATVDYTAPEKPSQGVPLAHLFREGRATGTVLLWVINFMNILNIYFLANWLPTVFTEAGFSLTSAVYIGTTLQAGGVVGTLVLGWLIGKRGYIPVLTASCGAACAMVAMIGQPVLTMQLLFMTVFAAGFCVVGGQAAINALGAIYYPTDLRSTGIGAALGVGRLGGIAGQPVAGILIGRGLAARELFLTAAVPALIATGAVFSLRRYIHREPAPSQLQAKLAGD